ncbi:MAG: tmRNA-binding protein SmpB [Labilithrix sp.]|nr:tmRNA-binding protein SmpB [Labilithrix sp.]
MVRGPEMAAPPKTAQDDAIQKVIITNRRATFDYAVEEKFEGGLVLVGSEVKSMRAGKAEMVDAYATVERGELWLKQLYVAPFEQAKSFPHEPRRSRKVLVHHSEIAKIDRALSREGYTLIPLRLYWRRGHVKVELGLAKGKKTHDKRADIKAKTADREAKAAMGRTRKERG